MSVYVDVQDALEFLTGWKMVPIRTAHYLAHKHDATIMREPVRTIYESGSYRDDYDLVWKADVIATIRRDRAFRYIYITCFECGRSMRIGSSPQYDRLRQNGGRGPDRLSDSLRRAYNLCSMACLLENQERQKKESKWLRTAQLQLRAVRKMLRDPARKAAAPPSRSPASEPRETSQV